MRTWRCLLLRWIPNKWVKKGAYLYSSVTNKLIPLSLDPPLPNNVCIDPSTICNLSCPLCPTALRELEIQRQFMDYDTFCSVVDKMPYIRYLSMFNWGEPFLNPDIFHMIRYAKEKGITVGIHSNFSFRKEEKFFKQIIDSGLNKLVISCDGAGPESYNKYRIGGDFNLVYDNMKRLCKYRKTTPTLVWQIVINKYNEHEIPRIRQLAREMHIEWAGKTLRLGYDMCADWEFQGDNPRNQREYWLPKNKKYVGKVYLNQKPGSYRQGICYDLFNTVVINPDGTVQPCCAITKHDNCFGDLKKQSFEEIWYGEKYRSARALFLKKNIDTSTRTICHRCRLFCVDPELNSNELETNT